MSQINKHTYFVLFFYFTGRNPGYCPNQPNNYSTTLLLQTCGWN